MKQYIQTELAPQPLGCYSQAILSNHTLYLAGQLGLDPETLDLPDTVEAQLEQIFLNMASVIQAAGGDLKDIVKLTVYLKDYPRDRKCVDEVMDKYFDPPYPVRTTIGVAALPRDALVEIDAIAVLDKP